MRLQKQKTGKKGYIKYSVVIPKNKVEEDLGWAEGDARVDLECEIGQTRNGQPSLILWKKFLNAKPFKDDDGFLAELRQVLTDHIGKNDRVICVAEEFSSFRIPEVQALVRFAADQKLKGKEPEFYLSSAASEETFSGLKKIGVNVWKIPREKWERVFPRARRYLFVGKKEEIFVEGVRDGQRFGVHYHRTAPNYDEKKLRTLRRLATRY